MSYSFEDAKKDSLHKWNRIFKRIKYLYDVCIENCGFCNYAYEISINNVCENCIVNDKCDEMKDKVLTKLDDIELYIVSNLIPYIEELKLNNHGIEKKGEKFD